MPLVVLFTVLAMISAIVYPPAAGVLAMLAVLAAWRARPHADILGGE